ncbi:Crossover junction endonuclease MUS81 [Durusdinium trenchii]|uniref:Crossover junction endonuclease MUS81 n=1 Tax=Durusdinium trenchii TaxID=1381693 RepID=A0ABP0NBT9_9DINO
MVKVWNSDLAQAAEVRMCYHMSKGSSREFMWRKAHRAILAVEKEIRQLSSGRIVNLPRIKEITAIQELEAVIRGERPIVPPEMKQAADDPPERDFARHPYLKRMQFRGGGYAILMALHLRSKEHMETARTAAAAVRQFMYKVELIHAAQPFCDVSMEGGWGSSCGWTSIRSLLAHRLVLESRGPTHREEYRLTEEGQDFVQAMLKLWPEAEGPAPPASNQPAASVDPDRSRTPRPRWLARTFHATRVTAAATPFSALKVLRPVSGPVSEVSPEALRPMCGPEPEESSCVKIEISDSEETEEPRATDAVSQGSQSTDAVLRKPAAHAALLLVDDRERLKDAEPRRFFETIAAATSAAREHLKLGDFAWVLGRSEVLGGSDYLDSELVDCLLERKRIADLVGRSAVGDHMKQLHRMEDCGLKHAFFLLEGNPNMASSCPVFDQDLHTESVYTIHGREEIDAFCAQLIIRNSKVGVLQSRDPAGTARLLKYISAWMTWKLQTQAFSHDLRTGHSLREFEKFVAQQMKDEGRLALLGGSSSSSVPGRMAELHVSRGLFVRVGRPANTEKVSWLVSDNGNRGIEHLAAELSVHENGHRSQPILTVIINAGLLLQEINAAAQRAASQAALISVAEAAAASLASQLPGSPSQRPSRRLLIVEGLHKSVQASARAPASLPLDELLPCAELVVFLMDLKFSWRCRVHDIQPAETTKSFLQVLLRLALELEVVNAPQVPQPT